MDRISSIIKENTYQTETLTKNTKYRGIATDVEHLLSEGVPEADIARMLNISIHNIHLMALDASRIRRSPSKLQENLVDAEFNSSTTDKVKEQTKKIGK